MDNAQGENIAEDFGKSSLRKKYAILFVFGAAFVLVGVAGAVYFLWYVPQVQAREYVAKSQPFFEAIAKEIPTIKENTFLDRNTQYHRRKDARDDAVLDIEELETELAEIRRARQELERLPLSKRVVPLHAKVQNYLNESERVLSLNLADQVFYRKVIDAYGDDLDREIAVYDQMRYSGGERTPFIIQTQSVVDFAEDALSRMNNLQVPEGVDPFAYEIRKENLQDIKETFLKFNEYYRLFQYELIDQEVEASTKRNEERNERIKEHGRQYIEKSNIAQGFRSLEAQAEELEKLYAEAVLW